MEEATDLHRTSVARVKENSFSHKDTLASVREAFPDIQSYRSLKDKSIQTSNLLEKIVNFIVQ